MLISSAFLLRHLNDNYYTTNKKKVGKNLKLIYFDNPIRFCN